MFSGLIFSKSLADWPSVQRSLIAFCAASSAIYLLNDLQDVQADRRHPSKNWRPLAEGTLTPSTEVCLMLPLFLLAVGGSLALNAEFAGVLAAYVGANVAYSHGLKCAVILDALLLASGFVFRAVAGALAISVVASSWLVLCTLLLALLVEFGKRRQERHLLKSEAGEHRKTLAAYTVPFLDQMMGISAAAALLSCALYTMADETVANLGTQGLVLTTPFVLYGIFRYLHLSRVLDDGGDPAHLFLTDGATMINAALWILSVCLIVDGPQGWFPW